MKRCNKFLLMFLIFSLILNMFISDVIGVAYSGNWYFPESYRFAGIYGNGYLSVRIAKLNDVTIPVEGSVLGSLSSSISYFKLNNASISVGVNSIIMHYDYNADNKVVEVEFKNVPSVITGDVIEFQMSYSGYQNLKNGGSVAVSGNLYFKGKIGTKMSNGWFIYDLMQPSFSLIYNNDYNYVSNTASFTLQYSNFSFNYFTFLNTDTPQGSTIYGYHLLNYNLTQSGSTYIVHCSFDNTFVNLSNPHYLFWTVHGLDADGNPIDLSGFTSFDLNAPNVPQVPKGVLVITSPKTGDNFASGTTQIPVSVVYGGDVTDVTDPNYNHTSVTVGATHALHNAGYVNLTSYSIINGTTVWSGTLNLNPGEGDGEYTLLASLDRTTLMSDTVTITIGGTTGNPILDFLKAVWAEFKDWFVKTMKVLFVPNATDFSSQIAQGWVQVSNPLPGVTPQYTIDIPMSTTLGTQNGVATIDFKTPITSWSGYSTMQSVIRLGLYTLLVFVIWSMVT